MIKNKLEQFIIYIAIYYKCELICAAYWSLARGSKKIMK
ncbi:protein of unknown function [Clostridium beijerinckii]|nr:protein of unknown function [Clostridium beijerinckii]